MHRDHIWTVLRFVDYNNITYMYTTFLAQIIKPSQLQYYHSNNGTRLLWLMGDQVRGINPDSDNNKNYATP